MDKNEKQAHKKRYTKGEEIVNAGTHGLGVVFSISALVLLIEKALRYAPPEMRVNYIVGFVVFGVSMIILYLSSTLYHALPMGAKKVFGVFDHSAIYILIAGTYTPFCLTALIGTFGWTIFGIIWFCTIVGISLYAVFGKKMKILSLATYIVMGWIVVIAIKPLYEILPWMSFLFLILGGIAYTGGCVFYAMKLKWMHGVWHVFVIIGSILHFFSLYYCL